MPYVILTAALVGLDQLVKYLVLQHIELGAHVPFIPHVLELTYVQNTGAAFSLFTGHTWLLTIISLAVSVALAAALVKGVLRHPFARCALAVVLAGAVGNLIDRAFLRFVTDMFRTLFLDFPVFNVADICVVAGGIGAALYYLLLAGKLEPKEEKDHEAADADR